MKRLLILPALALILGFAGLSMQSSSAHAQGLMPAPAVDQLGGGMCVNGSVPSSLGCTSGFLPNYPFNNSFYGSAWENPFYGNSYYGSAFSPFYGNSFGGAYANYMTPSFGSSFTYTAPANVGFNSEFANVACLAGYIGYPCGNS